MVFHLVHASLILSEIDPQLYSPEETSVNNKGLDVTNQISEEDRIGGGGRGGGV